MTFYRRFRGLNHQCSRCRRIFCHPMDLDQHRSLVHTKKKRIYCFLCEFSCLSTTYLKWHCFKDHSARDKDTFQRDYDWKGQLKKIQTPHRFTCSSCLAIFPDKKYLQLHKQTFHGVEKNFSCSMCKSTFKCPVNLKNHRTSHMMNKPFQCSRCQFKCRSLLLLKWHERNLHQNVSIAMTKFKKYSDQRPIASLQLHFICSKCQKTFENATQLQQHTTQAHNEVNRDGFECYRCNWQFKDERSLINHRQIYPECQRLLLTQVHQCKHCQYETDNGFKLRRHLKTKHKCTKQAVLGRKRFLCEYKSVSMGNLKRHLMFKHTKEGPYECSVCSKPFVEKSAQLRHESLVHGDETKQLCTICNKEFKHSKLLKEHLLKRHQQLLVEA